MVFASFIRKAADVKAVRDVLGADGKNIKVLTVPAAVVARKDIVSRSDLEMPAKRFETFDRCCLLCPPR